MPTCPSHPATGLKPEKKGWYCEECGENVFSYDQLPRLSEGGNAAPTHPKWPGDLDPATLPTWLAHPWAALCAESHPRVRLHWLVDTAELVVRWTAAVALAEVVHAHAGTLPAPVTDAIAEHVESPTLGRWLLILRTLVGVAPEAPLLTPTLFPWARETLAPCFKAEERGGSVETSLLELRSHVAHGGGIGRERARVLVDAHLPTLVALLAGVRDTLGGAILVADGAQLVGTRPAPTATSVPGPGPWLVGEAGVLPLEPLVHYGPVLRVGPDGALHPQAGGSAPQVYTRGSRDRLRYTTLGTDASHSDRFDVNAFRALFQLDRARGTRARDPNAVGGFVWDDFVQDARQQARHLIGRTHEIAQAKEWLKSRDPRGLAPRVGWISAGPGVGKSMLMARLVADYVKGTDKGIYYHRFRGGDGRNDRRSFLRLLQASLLAWAPLAAVTAPPAEDADGGTKLEADVLKRLDAIAGLTASNPRSMPPAFWVFVDGLDEAAGADRGLPELLRKLALPGTVWLVAGRPEHGLDLAFATPDCEAVFAGGLPLMHAGDIRAMLMAGLDGGRYALLARDEDVGEDVKNPFVDAVAARAQGLPLYVHLLLEDLGAGHFDVRSEARLPDGLNAYYDAILERIGTSDAKHYLTKIVALLARAEDPLDAPGLALLLASGRPEHTNRYLAAVEGALRAGAMLLRRAPGPDTSDGWALYHQSFRDYVGRTNTLATSVWEAEQSLVDAAAGWGAQTSPELLAIRNHLFRWGTAYCLRWGGAAGRESARARLTDFAYLQARTAVLPAAECAALAPEYGELAAMFAGDPRHGDLRAWADFFGESVHLLRRGDAEWPANRILLQLAVEHADESPVTKAAESWLETGACDWVWLRRAKGQRPKTVRSTGLIAVLEGHRAAVTGALELADGRLLSWSRDVTLRLWSEDGAPLAVLKGHTHRVSGATVLPDGRLLSWSNDKTLRLWGGDGAPLAVLAGHKGSVNGVTALPDGRLLSWSSDGTLRLWAGDGAPIAVLEGHTEEVVGATPLPDGQLLSWSWDGTLRLWDDIGGQLAVLVGHTGPVFGATPLLDGRVVSWSLDRTLRLWDRTGAPIRALKGHTAGVYGAVPLPDGRLLSWSEDGTLRLWDGAGASIALLDGHKQSVEGATPLPDGRLLSWSSDGKLRLWDSAGALTAVLAGHATRVNGAMLLPDGRILSWSEDGALRLWGGDGDELAVLEGHTKPVDGATPLTNGRLVSWSGDRTLRLWDGTTMHYARNAAPNGDRRPLEGIKQLRDGRLLSWSRDRNLRLWAGDGTLIARLQGHTSFVVGAKPLPDGRLLSWSADGALRLWDADGAPLTTLKGHTQRVEGVKLLQDGRLLSWAKDGTIRLWDLAGKAIAVFGNATRLGGDIRATQLLDGRLLSWLANRLPSATGDSLQLWDRNGVPISGLTGHTGPVVGATPLPDGRLLSWSMDYTLRLWDGDGAPISVLKGHTKAVEGATPLPDGRLLSWSRDGTLRLWDGAGAPLACIRQRHFRHTHPDLQLARRSVEAPETVVHRTAAEGNLGGLALWHAGHPTPWHTDGDWSTDHLLPDGAVVARCDKHLALLHLHHGNRRVSVQEAEALSGSPPRHDQ